MYVHRSRYRSVRYDLDAALDVARLIDSAGGPLASDILAPALGYSGTNNGAYLSRIASARLFGLVDRKGTRFEVTERGRCILSGSEPSASSSRREAFLAVPLFLAVAEHVGRSAGMLPDDLADWMVEECGEVAAKAPNVSRQFVASARQAGMLTTDSEGNLLLTTSTTYFTSVDNQPSHVGRPQLRWPWNDRSFRKVGGTVADDRLWLDEPDSGEPQGHPKRRRGPMVAIAAAVAVIVAVPIALVATGATPRSASAHRGGQHATLGNGPAEHQVLSALSATTDSGSFNFSYDISSTPATAASPTTTSTTVCSNLRMPVPPGYRSGQAGNSSGQFVYGGVTSGGVVNGSAAPAYSSSVSMAVANGGVTSVGTNGGAVFHPTVPTGVTQSSLPPGWTWKTQRMCQGPPTVSLSPEVKGGGIINTSPAAMVASAHIGNGLDVSVRVDGSTVYESGSNDTGLAPQGANTGPTGGSGASIPAFAGLTESTLGNREGAVAMMGMASPTGYLDLVQPSIGAATQTGTSTVDGVSVTIYTVANDVSKLPTAPGVSSAESQALTEALGVLKTQGFVANTSVISVDGAGFIRKVISTDTFSDGGSVTLSTIFSNFGCAGTVLMPGQSGSGVPPANCTSPDNPSAPTTTPTTAGNTPTTSVATPTTPTTPVPTSSTTSTTLTAPSTVPTSSTTSTSSVTAST